MGAPPSAVFEQKTTVPREEDFLSKSKLRQCLIKLLIGRSTESLPEVLRKLRARFRAVEGEDSMKHEGVTDNRTFRGHSSCRLRSLATIRAACCKN